MTAATSDSSATIPATRERGPNLVVSIFEWLGELCMFCARLARAAVTPPYEIANYLAEQTVKDPTEFLAERLLAFTVEFNSYGNQPI